jgi:hypothetical protein
MPFIRYSRDKRGNECTLVMHAYRPAQGPARTRVLYLFRSPAHLKIGRQPLDAEVVEALEHTHPDLSFDWTELRKEPRPDPRPRPLRRTRPERRKSSPPRSSATVAVAVAVAPVEEPLPDDDSLLGRVAGAREAARLRSAYATLIQRISRRARTPEDRDRLLDRAGRLNPEGWPDEAAVTAGLQSVDASWDAVASELPQRRRGRRGGRRREREGDPHAGAGDDQDASGIMTKDHVEESPHHAPSHDETLDDADRPADGGGDVRGPGGPAGAGSADVPDGG